MQNFILLPPVHQNYKKSWNNTKLDPKAYPLHSMVLYDGAVIGVQ